MNGLSVVADNHQAAIVKIKSVRNETKLLVVDPQADEYFREKGLALGGGVDFVHTIEAPASKPAGRCHHQTCVIVRSMSLGK